MTDIVERLRNLREVARWPIISEAADEIERLRERVEMVMSINHQQGDEIERLRGLCDNRVTEEQMMGFKP